MRKYLKSKDQGDNNSNIFKEAKRRFHYEPSHKQNKYFLHSKHKPHPNSHQFKDDFSSVKEIKNENNQINESSWIVKLVNVMHENSEEDAKAAPADPNNNFLSLRPIQSKEITQEPPKHLVTPLPTLKQQSNEVTPLATKKNSVNTEMINNKKRSKSQKSESCDTVSRKSKNHSKVETIKRTKNEVDLKRNRSQSLLKAPEVKQEQENVRSLKNIASSKANTEKVKIECNSTISEHNLSSKHISGNLAIESKHSLQTNKQMPQSANAAATSSIQKQAEEQQKFHSSICYQEIKENILTEDIPDDLFALSTNHKSTVVKTESHLTTQKRLYVGSIKKNKPCGGSEGKTPMPTPKQEQGKYHEQRGHRQSEAVIIEKKEEDIVTAREEQHLIDKYLNNDYSFKKQSNMFKYEYSTSDFDRSLLHLNKPAIQLEKPPNSAKATKYDSYQSRRSEKNQSNLDKYEDKQLKKDPAKKFNYFSENAEKQTTENSLSVEILTLRCNQDPRPKEAEYPKKEAQYPNFTKQAKNEAADVFPNYRPVAQFKSANEEDLRRIHQKYSYNKENETKGQLKKNSASSVPTKRENLIEIKPQVINRNPYLQESVYKQEELPAELRTNSASSYEYPTFKLEPKGAPATRQRADSNFNIENLHSISRRERTDSDLFSEAESDQLITRLNSKLNTYIHQYQLEKQNQAVSSRQNEPTHRRMNLDFHELKKHHDLFQR